VVSRTTATAAELTSEELKRGAASLRRKIRRHGPRFLAVLGMKAYRVGFGDPGAQVGPQDRTIDATTIWLLPNPSGLNAHYQLPDLAREFRKLSTAMASLPRQPKAPKTHPAR